MHFTYKDETGIVETLPATSLQIYPNPTTGQLTIKSEQLSITNIAIYDIVGKMVISSMPQQSQETTIDVSHLPSGIYYLRIDNQTVKIVKQ